MARPIATKFLATDQQRPSGLAQLQEWQTQLNLGAGSELDGSIVDIGFANAVFSDAAFSRSDFAAAVQVVRQVSAPETASNFQLLDLSAMTAPWSDDGAFAQMAIRLEAAGAMVQQAGMRGVLLANQMYGTSIFAVPAGSELQFTALEALVRRRGADLTAAILRGFPSVQIMVLWAYSEMFREVCVHGRVLSEHPYALYPAFLDGMREALARSTNGARLIDGYLPAYPVRTPAHFEAFAALVHADEAMLVRNWRPDIVTHWDDVGQAPGPLKWPSSFALTCDRSVASRLLVPLPTAFGIMVDYNVNDFPEKMGADVPQLPLSPELLGSAISAAARASDTYVWLYAESSSWWLQTAARPLVGDATRHSVKAARTRLASDPLGLSP